MIDPLEIARQMTLIDQSLFLKLEPSEFLGGSWNKTGASKLAPNIYNCIVRFNITSRWVIAEILREESQKTRILLLSHFLRVAEVSPSMIFSLPCRSNRRSTSSSSTTTTASSKFTLPWRPTPSIASRRPSLASPRSRSSSPCLLTP